MRKRLVYIDLFSGCGGLSLGLLNAGWRGLFAIEKNPMAFSSLHYNLIQGKQHFNWPKWLPERNHDINDVVSEYASQLDGLRGKITLVAGGPPCQGFSTAGKRDENDIRNRLVDSYIEFIRIVQPKLIFLENVKGFTIGFKKESGRGTPFSIYVQESLKSLGYKLTPRILDIADFGIPQRRKRYILVGSLEKDPTDFFSNLERNKIQFLSNKGLNLRTSLGEAISDLLQIAGTLDCPDSKGFKSGIYSEPTSQYQRLLRGEYRSGEIPDSHRFANHSPEMIKIFQNIVATAEKDKRLSGKMREQFNLKKRGIFPLSGNNVCATLTTHPDDYIHYCEPRILTVREYARIQSFPDWYHFKGKYTTGGDRRVKETPRYTQLGNAIPPLFAEQIGIILKKLV